MKARHKRSFLLLIAVAFISTAVIIVIKVFNENLVFFYSPAEVYDGSVPNDRKVIRLGGMVVAGSVNRNISNTTVHFEITDNIRSIKVEYSGILPDLFREGKGVVVQGMLDESQVFKASQVLAKHDENYMPPEVADLLKEVP